MPMYSPYQIELTNEGHPKATELPATLWDLSFLDR
jgi:hypothetical protein